ncbi:MAG: hypothetical protein RLZ98_17 [Pseudomonadota bacterium]|jgi:membrane peptidoglycan carboxypeptidase
MLALIRFLTRFIELALALPLRLFRFVIGSIAFNPRLGPARYLVQAGLLYVAFALVLVYVIAPLRAVTGAYYAADKLHYDAERWLATAIYDRAGNFVGTYDPRLDSQRDVNFTDAPIEFADHVANPDHKSIPVRQVPEHYWRCLVHLEDRYIGTWANPYGIDLLGVLKIPYSTVRRSIALRRPSIGFGGSTLPMQLARVIYKTPPSRHESAFAKLRRKLSEWWLAPVIYEVLTPGGDHTPLKQWAANHLWLAQRTGGQSLHGVEFTSQIVFGKEAKDLSPAEQFVLASAVNRPIILLEGNEKLNAVRLDRWRHIIEVRAKICVEQLMDDEPAQKQALFELVRMASGPPEPQVRPTLQQALERHEPRLAERAEVNPIIRANTLMPAGRLGIREEMKQAFGYDWRSRVRGVNTTLDVAENLAFNVSVEKELAALQKAWTAKIKPGFTLDRAQIGPDRHRPDIIVVAANAKGEIVRYFETNQTSPYFGSTIARDPATGVYRPSREPRQIASTGKMLAAIAIANNGRDTIHSPYADDFLPATGIDSCARTPAPVPANGRTRQAIIAFACSLNNPIEWRLARLGQSRTAKLIEAFHFTMPPSTGAADATPPTTAAVRGLVSGSPQRVHQMAAVVLASLTGRGNARVAPPTLVHSYDFTTPESAAGFAGQSRLEIRPNDVVHPQARPLVKALLSAPLCQVAYSKTIGTLKALAHWCHARRADLSLHFAKTGTSVTTDPDETVDTWIAGGLQFTNGAAYSYVVLVGTGAGSRPWARSLHSGQVAAPLADVLLKNLADLSRREPAPRQEVAASSSGSSDDAATARAVKTGSKSTYQSLFERWGRNPFSTE